MIDIIGIKDGDIDLFSTDTGRAANILSVQLGSLEYAPELGIDLTYFLAEEFRVQNESFKAYLVEVLARNGINVVSIVETVESLAERYNFNLAPVENSTGLIAR